MDPRFRPALDTYRMAGVVTDNQGELAELLLPMPAEVVRVADMLAAGVYPYPDAELPVSWSNIWDRDNWGTVTIILAGYRDWNGRQTPCLAANIKKINEAALMWMVAGYLTLARDVKTGIINGAEQTLCNGSSLVADLLESGYWIKDPPAVPHDIEWASRFAKIPDVFGRLPDFHRSNLEYRDVMIGMGHETAAALRFEALESPLAAAKWALHAP